MAAIYSTGPALAYVNVLTIAGGVVTTPNGTATYLGTFERPPKINISPAYTPVMNDLGGTVLPTDRVFQGQEAQISGTMNRFNMTTMQGLMRQNGLPAVIVAPGNQAAGLAIGEGTNTLAAYGGLMNQDVLGFVFYIVFSRGAVAAQTAVGLIPGYRFFSTFLEGPHDISAGSGEFKQAVSFRAQRLILPSVAGPLLTGMSCYDHAVAGMPPIN